MKLRGQRIELGEIEHALRAQPGVVDAVVLLDTRLDALVAYVSPPSAAVSGAVLSDGSPFTPAEAFGRASSLGGATAALPAYMVPSLVVGVATWPRTSSGKIDRKRLPAPEGGAAGGGGGGSMVVAPRSAAEVRVRDAFAAALGIGAEAISVEASFFELGGNSLRAVTLSRRLTEALGRPVSVADVLQRPTVAGLAAWGGDADAVVLPPLVRSVDATALLTAAHPVSWNQSQLLTVHVVDGATAAYNIPMAWWLVGPLSVAALREAVGTVVERHAVLRTTYEVDAAGGSGKGSCRRFMR